MTSYRLALPHPWQRIPLGTGTKERIADIITASIERLPPEIPPDQVAQARIRMEGRLLNQLREAEQNGTIDYYLPTDLMHGVLITASFTVSAIIPDASAPEGITGQVLANLLSSREGVRPVTVSDTVWARSEEVIDRKADQTIADDARARKVEYITAAPSDQRRWIIVTFTTLGDGDLDSPFTALMVDLFDAIMSTWRWQESV